MSDNEITSKLANKTGEILHVFNEGIQNSWRGLVLFENEDKPSFVESELSPGLIGDKISILGRVEEPFNIDLESTIISRNTIEARIDSFKHKKDLEIIVHGPKDFFIDMQTILDNEMTARSILWNIEVSPHDKKWIDTLVSEIGFNKYNISSPSIGRVLELDKITVPYETSVTEMQYWESLSSSDFLPIFLPSPSDFRQLMLSEYLASSYLQEIKQDHSQDMASVLGTLLYLWKGGNIQAVDFKMSAESLNTSNNISLLKHYAIKEYRNLKEINSDNLYDISHNVVNKWSLKQNENEIKEKVLRTFSELNPDWTYGKSTEITSMLNKFSKLMIKEKAFSDIPMITRKKIALNIDYMGYMIKKNMLSPGDLMESSKLTYVSRLYAQQIESSLMDLENNRLNSSTLKLFKNARIFIENMKKEGKNKDYQTDILSNIIRDFNQRATWDTLNKQTNIVSFMRRNIGLPILVGLNSFKNNLLTSSTIEENIWGTIQKDYYSELKEKRETIQNLVQNKDIIISQQNLSINEDMPMARLKKWGKKANDFNILNYSLSHLERDLTDSEVSQYNKSAKEIKDISYSIYMDKKYYDFLEKIDNPYGDLSFAINGLVNTNILHSRDPLDIQHYEGLRQGIEYINNPDVIKNYRHQLYLEGSNDPNALCLHIDGFEESVDWDKISSLQDATLENLKLSSEDLAYKNIQNATFQNCDFSELDGTHVDFSTCEMVECKGLNPTMNLEKVSIVNSLYSDTPHTVQEKLNKTALNGENI